MVFIFGRPFKAWRLNVVTQLLCPNVGNNHQLGLKMNFQAQLSYAMDKSVYDSERNAIHHHKAIEFSSKFICNKAFEDLRK